jgi:hypothetical protein
MQESCTPGPVRGASSGRRLYSTLPRLTHDIWLHVRVLPGPPLFSMAYSLICVRLRSIANDSANF